MGRRAHPVQVVLNVYDIHAASAWLQPFGLGIHHSGIEVHGDEWSFGGMQGGGDQPPPTMSGVYSIPPGSAGTGNAATFREAIVLGSVSKSSAEVKAIVDRLSQEFLAKDYNLSSRNCNIFSNALSLELLGVSIPGWVNRIARFASWFLPSDASLIESVPTAPQFQAFHGQGNRMVAETDSSTAPAVSSGKTDDRVLRRRLMAAAALERLEAKPTAAN